MQLGAAGVMDLLGLGSPFRIGWAVAMLLICAFAVVQVVRHRHRYRLVGVSWGWNVVIALVNVTLLGFYVPVGPVIALWRDYTIRKQSEALVGANR